MKDEGMKILLGVSARTSQQTLHTFILHVKGA